MAADETLVGIPSRAATRTATHEVGLDPPVDLYRSGIVFAVSALPFASVFIGAGLGACLRWWLGLRLNAVFPTIPLGTLASNIIGGYIIGVAMAFFVVKSDLPPETRLFVITGFLGGLTTFSTFSSEIVTLLGQSQIGWAMVAIGAHLFGSLAATAIGLLTTRWLLSAV